MTRWLPLAVTVLAALRAPEPVLHAAQQPAFSSRPLGVRVDVVTEGGVWSAG
jgi:hypothetical protein